MRTNYEPLLDYLVDQDELQTVMMMMIGELNASHTGVSGGPSDAGPSTGADAPARLRLSSFDPSGLLPRQPHLQGRSGRSRLPEDRARATTSSRSTAAT